VWAWRGLVTFDTLFVIELATRRLQIVGCNATSRRGLHGPGRLDNDIANAIIMGLDNALIDGDSPPGGASRIRRRQRLSGLLNYYDRAA
jgi:hypothetical protein